MNEPHMAEGHWNNVETMSHTRLKDWKDTKRSTTRHEPQRAEVT